MRSGSDVEGGDQVAVEAEAVAQDGDAAGEVPLQPLDGDPVAVLGALDRDQGGRVRVLRACGAQEAADLVAGPVRETYLVGPRDTDDPAAWRTEIGWPVFRVASR